VLYFQRDIEDLEENLEHTDLKILNKFVEINKHREIDQSAKALLDDLKYKKIPAKLPESNIFNFKVYFT
jgi:hypothetical protein